MALKISRGALLISLLLWGLFFTLGMLHMINPLAALALGGYAAIALGLSAAVCVFFQGLSFKSKPRHPENSN
jgi:succinate-acetate transporter protein